MLYKILLSLILSSSLAFGVSKRAVEIRSHYKSLAKDFLIYEHIKKKSTSKQDAFYLYKEVYRLTPRLKRLFYKKTKDKSFIYSPPCKKCNTLHLSPNKFSKMKRKEKLKLYKKLRKKHSKKELFWLRAIMAKNTFKTLTYGDGKSFLKVFNSVDKSYRHKYLDKYIPSKFLSRLANQRGFTRFAMQIIMDKKYKKISASLLKLNPKRKKLSFDTAFYVGLLALQKGYRSKALKFFKRAKQETKRKSFINKIQFWEYQTTKNKKILKILANGSDLNFYTLWAKEKLGLNNVELINPNPRKLKKKNFNISDPFLWAKALDASKKLSHKKLSNYAKRFYTKQTLPYYAFFEERASFYTKNFFLTPFERYLGKVDRKRRALIYSIARQESRFIPSAVSTSYALGMMQFMPFLAKATAKELGIKNFKYFDMFKPKTALLFANHHLDYLENILHEPLFIAYAYNGGIGFTKKLFTQRGLFKKGKYEPFMSMELVHYRESREYAKKVITNYAQYARIYKLNIKLSHLYKNITKSNPFKHR